MSGLVAAADGASGDEVRRLGDVAGALQELALRGGMLERGWQVRGVAEAEAQRHVLDAVVGVTEVVHGEPLVGGDVRDVQGAGGDQDDVLVQDSVVLVFARSASGVVSLPGCGNTAIPGHARMPRARTPSMNSASEPSLAARVARTRARPRCQVVMTVNTTIAMSSGSHPPCATLDRFAVRKAASTPPNATAASTIFHAAPLPQDPGHHQEQDRVDDQGAGDGDAVRGGEVARRTGRSSMSGNTPTNRIALTPGRYTWPTLVLGGLLDRQRRQQPQLHRLAGQAERRRR